MINLSCGEFTFKLVCEYLISAAEIMPIDIDIFCEKIPVAQVDVILQ